MKLEQVDDFLLMGSAPSSFRAWRDTPIVQNDKEHLYNWISAFLGIHLATSAVCEGHSAPFDAFSDIYFKKPSLALVLGSRGSGKSMMSAFQAHLNSRFLSEYAARIMGGSEQQSRQIYDAINTFIVNGKGPLDSDADTIEAVLKREAHYANGSKVAILPASMKSSRGPHVPGLFLDEIDEIKRDIFESAIGMAQENIKRGHKTQIVMTSTWHHEAGLMGEQIGRARDGAFPLYEFCAFEVLERCPEERSGPELEKCPECPIVQWCHADIDSFGRGVPKAKRASGHYSIETFIQKAAVLGEGVIRADYLCQGPRAEGIWFRTFGDENIATDMDIARRIGEYHPEYPVYVAIDYGVCTAALGFQIRKRSEGLSIVEDVHVFGEYYSDGLPAAENARAIRTTFEALMHGKSLDQCKVTMDPAGNSRDPIGPTGLAEYRRGGIRHVQWWPAMTGHKKDSLALVDSFIKSGTGQRHLFIHPRCTMLAQAFKHYSRKKVGDIFLPMPADPQHPWEDLIDALAGGLTFVYPNGRPQSGSIRRKAHVASIA